MSALQGFESRNLAAQYDHKISTIEPGLLPPRDPHPSNREFVNLPNGTSMSTAGLTWANQGSNTATVENGRLVMNHATTSNQVRGVFMATPGTGNIDFATYIKPHYLISNNQSIGLGMLWGTPASHTNLEVAGAYYNSGLFNLAWTTFGSDFVPDSDRTSANQAVSLQGLYIVVSWDGTDLIYYASQTGTIGSFKTVYTATLGFGRPDYIGWTSNPGTGGVAYKWESSFLRFNWTASDYLS